MSQAIAQAHRIIMWQENLFEEDMPPEWMWTVPWKLDEWFEDVQRRRDEKYGKSDDDDDEVAEMMGNELARDRR